MSKYQDNISTRMANIVWKQPEPFIFVAEKWPAWKEVYDCFRKCSKSDKETINVQRDSLYFTMGAVEAKKIAANFKFEGKY